MTRLLLAGFTRSLTAKQADQLAKKLRGVWGEIEPLTLKTAQHVDELAVNMTEAVNQSQKERDELEGMATDAQRVALEIQRINERLEETDLGIRVARSALQAAESSPFGFAQAFQARMKLAREITDKINELRQQWELIQSLENQTKEDRKKALEVEEKINQLIAERNVLLKQQMRGYLDAVLAQASQSGEFEKIVIDQTRNLGMALAKGLVKKNPLLGQVGADAAKFDVHPFRFSTDMEANVRGLEKFADDQLRNLGVKPTAGDKGIIAKIEETNRLLRRAAIPVPQPMRDVAIAAGESREIITRLEPRQQAQEPGQPRGPKSPKSQPTPTIGNASKASELMTVVAKATRKMIPILAGIEDELSEELDLGVDHSRSAAQTGGHVLNTG